MSPEKGGQQEGVIRSVIKGTQGVFDSTKQFPLLTKIAKGDVTIDALDPKKQFPAIYELLGKGGKKGGAPAEKKPAPKPPSAPKPKGKGAH